MAERNVIVRDEQARQDAADALAAIRQHEAVCQSRHESAVATQERIERAIDRINGRLMIAATGIIGMLATITGVLILIAFKHY